MPYPFDTAGLGVDENVVRQHDLLEDGDGSGGPFHAHRRVVVVEGLVEEHAALLIDGKCAQRVSAGTRQFDSGSFLALWPSDSLTTNRQYSRVLSYR